MAYLGQVPSEHSSGTTRQQGAITKAGNGSARRMLIEAAWSYRFPARISRLTAVGAPTGTTARPCSESRSRRARRDHGDTQGERGERAAGGDRTAHGHLQIE